MKKTINFLTLIIILISPVVVSAQTQNETWITLGEYLKDKYSKKGAYLIPNNPYAFLYVTKLAYKTPDETVVLPKSEIIINKVDHIENHGIPVFDKNDPIVVNQLFEIKQNGKQTQEYNVTNGENGWKIIDLKGAGSLTSILVKQKSKTNDNDIFDHIYVTLDETQNPYKIKEEIRKANEDKKLKAEKLRNEFSVSSLPIVQ